MVDKRKAVVHMGPMAHNYSLMLPVAISEEEAMNIVVPPQSAVRVNLKERGRVVLPKAVLEAHGIHVGDDVDLIILPVVATDGVLDE